ncbi:cytochrome P450 [Podospora aff. communis PSN243]|uniref:Cytochrome P450 n=1 Tax=Podospora aff. communis PSN243 TaxID=3040156 RepID=A0AAV9GEM3_9PEZI|nr:cytochrome P450 [Podospora aff. communis PSN243]
MNNMNDSHAPWPVAGVGSSPSTHAPSHTSLDGFTIVAVAFFLVMLLYKAVTSKYSLLHFASSLGPIRYLQRRYAAWRFLFDGPGLIQAAYEKAGTKPFEVLAPDARYVFVTSPEHVKEIDSAEDKLSLYYASRQILQPQYTMHHFGWFDRPLEGTGFVRALRVHLTNAIPKFLPGMKEMVKTRFAELQKRNPVIDGVTHTPLAKTIIKTVCQVEAHAIFGKELARNEEFLENAVTYIEQLALNAEIIRAFPEWMAPFVGRFVGQFHGAQRFIFHSLMPIVAERCREREMALSRGEPIPKHDDCIQWLLDSSPSKVQRTPRGVAHEVMAIWFAALHPISVTIIYALEDLCLHPEYLDPIREEIRTQYSSYEATTRGLPLLDSFIKESARLSPVESQSCRRRAIAPFTLSDGTKLSPGDWACTPVTSMMQDAKWYPSPLEFSGFRFAPPELVASLGDQELNVAPRQEKPSKLVKGDSTFYMWGAEGKQGCPGRYYAVALAKVVISHLVEEYDIELVDPTAPRWWTWRTTRVPSEETMAIFTPRRS